MGISDKSNYIISTGIIKQGGVEETSHAATYIRIGGSNASVGSGLINYYSKAQPLIRDSTLRHSRSVRQFI